MKNRYVRDYQPNDRVAELFLLSRKEIRPSRKGSDYLFLVLSDRTGSVSAFMWENVDRFRESCDTGDHVYVEGLAREYNGTVQVTVHKIRRIPAEQVDRSDFIPASETDPDQAFGEIVDLIQHHVDSPPLRRLLLDYFAEEEVMRRFKACPAAKVLHHAYVGGLQDHTLSIMRLAVGMCEHYPFLNRSLLLAGAALHDAGKIEELSWENSFDYTDAGRLLGHITLEVMDIDRRIRFIPDFPDDLRLQLLHLLLSHHRELEFGSPRQPMTMEALVLSYLDDLDAKVQSFKEAMSQAGDSRGWTSYHQNLQRHLYRKPFERELARLKEEED